MLDRGGRTDCATRVAFDAAGLLIAVDLSEHFNRAVVPPPDIREDVERAAYDHHGWLDLMNQAEEPPKPQEPEQGIDL